MKKFLNTLKACGVVMAAIAALQMRSLAADAEQNARESSPKLPREIHIYKKVEGRELKLFVIKPPGWKSQKEYPAIVLFHGGGWVGGKPEQLNTQADYFAERGMVSVLVQYRLLEKGAKRPPIMCVQDAKSAMRWVRGHARELGVNSRRIAAGGGSAGGHLSAFVGMVNGLDDPKDDLAVSPKANALVLFNPVFNNGPGEYGYDRVGELYREYSPAHNITSNAPPAIVFLGTKDRLIPVKTVKDFQAGMKAVGVRCEAFFYEGQGHGFFKKEPYHEQTLAEADKFLTSLGWLESTPVTKDSKGKESAGETQSNQSK